MSGSSSEYASRHFNGAAKAYLSEDTAYTRSRAKSLREAEARTKSADAPVAKPYVPSKPIQMDMAVNTITAPPRDATEMHIFVVDNSGSNRRIAKAIMERAGNITGVLHSLLPNAAVGFLFFSDHCDGSGGLFQEVGYTPATPEGEEALRASIANLQQAVGGDAPEAIECALMRASRYNFGSIPKNQRFLYLITDVVAHGMGMKDDNGCPDQVDWRRALRRVYETYNSFQVIASGDDADTFELQKQFISPERLRFDLMDLASDARLDHAERCELVPNACLFLAARNRGIQTVGAFLTGLYETWLASNRYGAQTAPRARKQIGQMALHYLEAPEAELRKMLERVFGDRFTDY